MFYLWSPGTKMVFAGLKKKNERAGKRRSSAVINIHIISVQAFLPLPYASGYIPLTTSSLLAYIPNVVLVPFLLSCFASAYNSMGVSDLPLGGLQCTAIILSSSQDFQDFSRFLGLPSFQMADLAKSQLYQIKQIIYCIIILFFLCSVEMSEIEPKQRFFWLTTEFQRAWV